MLTTAIEAEVAQWIGEHEHLRNVRGYRQVGRNEDIALHTAPHSYL
jgi:hypothetical protein